MLHRLAAAVSGLALLVGFVGAPHSHVHLSGEALSDAHDHHSPPPTLLHAHVTPHAEDPDHHHPPGSNDTDAEQRIWSVTFTSQPAAAPTAPAPALPVSVVPPVVPAHAWIAQHIPQPRAHGPPCAGGSDLRAPPSAPAAVS
jgi:hypothetical protein